MPDYIPDAYDLWEQHERKQQAELDRLPRCSECGEPIQDDECFTWGNETICLQCLKDNHTKKVEDLIE